MPVFEGDAGSFLRAPRRLSLSKVPQLFYFVGVGGIIALRCPLTYSKAFSAIIQLKIL